MFSAAPVTTITPAPDQALLSENPFEAARLTLITRLLQLRAPKAYPCSPSPSDHDNVAEHLREVAQVCDEWLAAIGAEVRDNTTTHVSAGLFSGSFTGAIDGNETFACTEAGMALIEYARGER